MREESRGGARARYACWVLVVCGGVLWTLFVAHNRNGSANSTTPVTACPNGEACRQVTHVSPGLCAAKSYSCSSRLTRPSNSAITNKRPDRRCMCWRLIALRGAGKNIESGTHKQASPTVKGSHLAGAEIAECAASSAEFWMVGSVPVALALRTAFGAALTRRPITSNVKRNEMRHANTLKSFNVGLTHKLAEREGFEPSVRFWRTHTFQACSFDRSDTSPGMQRLSTRCKGAKG